MSLEIYESKKYMMTKEKFLVVQKIEDNMVFCAICSMELLEERFLIPDKFDWIPKEQFRMFIPLKI